MQRLDCMQAPASVLVVRSNISIAEAVPVTVALAVAVSTTLSPARGEARSADKARVPASVAAVPDPRDERGTLGITGDDGDGLFEGVAGEVGEGRIVSSHAAGELSPDFAGSAGHAVRPSGRDD